MNPTAPQASIDFIRRLSQINERIRMLEERVRGIGERLFTLERTSTERDDELRDSIADVKDRISKLELEINELKNTIAKIAKDLQNTAKLSDLKVLEKYISLIDPTRFITRRDVEKVVERILRGER